MKPYRGLTKEDKCNWVYGWYLLSNGIHYIVDCYGVTSTALVLAHTISDLPGYRKVISKTVGQQVGRKDKNNTEIYGDDICKIKIRNGNERIGIVEWIDKDCGYHLQVFKATDGETGSHCISYSGSAVEGIYIIGNKHQHPNLLK